MNGAVYYVTKRGSTADYARWIGEATDMPVFAISDPTPEPSEYDFLVIGSPIYYYKLEIRDWLKANADQIRAKPTILFTVSGAGAGAKLDGWLADSKPNSLISEMEHFALRGRWRPEQLGFIERMLLTIAGLFNRDRQAGKEELEGFDYVDKDSIDPVVERIRSLQRATTPA